MTASEAVVQMETIIKQWEQKAKIIEERFDSLAPGQVEIVKAAIEACVDDLRSLLDEMKRDAYLEKLRSSAGMGGMR